MEMDEWIFSALEASNKKWTEHAAESEDANSDKDTEKESTIEEMKGEIAIQKAQIADQEEELTLQKEKMAKQSGEIKMLQEAVQKMQETLAASVSSSETIPLRAAEESVTAHATDLENITSDTVFLNGHVATQQWEIAMHCAAEQQLKD
jgi:chromosome segregation ATPase